ncbi:Na(+)/H(+) antiporter NhaA 1/4 [Clarias magur]|uniref:Na(+)/H(+) antiporter NhaA 1/4 n=1 Tax=Clarias magur TaxID=1594786 RepID=A0A8J4UF80_CLAMG|nr:Na(+)/H(+) antiporter NhaA 1/4 [Clarias magur]
MKVIRRSPNQHAQSAMGAHKSQQAPRPFRAGFLRPAACSEQTLYLFLITAAEESPCLD